MFKFLPFLLVLLLSLNVDDFGFELYQVEFLSTIPMPHVTLSRQRAPFWFQNETAGLIHQSQADSDEMDIEREGMGLKTRFKKRTVFIG